MAKKIKSKKQLYNFKNKYLLGAAIIVAVVL